MINVTTCPTFNWHQNERKRHTVVYDFKRTNNSDLLYHAKSGICRSLITNFRYLKYWRWSLFMQLLYASGQVCALSLLLHVKTPFCLSLSNQNKGNCKCYNKDLFRFVMTGDHHWLNLFALIIKVSVEKICREKDNKLQT